MKNYAGQIVLKEINSVLNNLLCIQRNRNYANWLRSVKYSPMAHAFIDKISCYLPKEKLRQADLIYLFPEIEGNEGFKKIGIQERSIAAEGELASDLAVAAAQKLFEEYNIDTQTIDFILFCAQEFDYFTPTTACVIHERLGLKRSAGAMDYQLGCSGFVYGLSLAKGLIEGGSVKNVLLLTSSTLTRKLNPKDKSSRAIFGDGAAATLISSRENLGVGPFRFGTDGSGMGRIILKDGGARNPISENSFKETEDVFGNITTNVNLKMDGTGILTFSLARVPRLVEETLLANDLEIEDVDLFIFHQANSFLLETLRDKIGIPTNKFFIFVEKMGNTVSSTIPIALKEAISVGKAKKGDKVLLAAFGVGLSWGATVITL